MFHCTNPIRLTQTYHENLVGMNKLAGVVTATGHNT